LRSRLDLWLIASDASGSRERGRLRDNLISVSLEHDRLAVERGRIIGADVNPAGENSGATVTKGTQRTGAVPLRCPRLRRLPSDIYVAIGVRVFDGRRINRNARPGLRSFNRLLFTLILLAPSARTIPSIIMLNHTPVGTWGTMPSEVAHIVDQPPTKQTSPITIHRTPLTRSRLRWPTTHRTNAEAGLGCEIAVISSCTGKP
jgi:hypothetical protein